MSDRTQLARRALALLLLLYWAALALATHLPSYGGGPARYSDKLAHFCGYAGLAFLLSCAWAVRRSFSALSAAAIWGICVLYGVLDEWLQVPIPGRTGEFADWLADAAGAFTGVAMFWLASFVTRYSPPGHA
jgi:VanZ family protein